MNKALSLLSLGLALALGACHGREASEAPPLAGAKLGGPFSLIDQDGHPFTDKQLLGHYAVVYFGYTFCPDVCPTEMQKLGQGLKLLEAKDPAMAAKVLPVFITVDPPRDTPAVLRQYVRAFSPRMIGLTGSDAAIAQAAKAYAVFYERAPSQEGVNGYLMQHSTAAMLFDPQGRPLALVPVDSDAAQVAQTLAKWVR